MTFFFVVIARQAARDLDPQKIAEKYFEAYLDLQQHEQFLGDLKAQLRAATAQDPAPTPNTIPQEMLIEIEPIHSSSSPTFSSASSWEEDEDEERKWSLVKVQDVDESKPGLLSLGEDI
jgi:hypothetical protein